MAELRSIAGVLRAPFLLLSVALVLCGAGAAAFDGYASVTRTALALVGLLAVHGAVNALNEWSDMRSGIDLRTVRTPFSGGSGTLPAGALSSGAALALGLVAAGLGLVIGLWFLAQVGWVLLPFLIVGGILVLGYTDFLARLGVGELAAGLGLGGLAVAGVALVQQGTIGGAAIAASVPAFLMTFDLLLLNEFPDEAADREGGRRNLVIVLGRPRAALAYSAAAILTPVSILAGVVSGAFPTLSLLALLPSLLLRDPLRWALRTPATEVPIPALGANVVWNLSTNIVLGATLMLASAL